MALAKKCDRCGKFYDEYNFAKDDKNINGIMTLNLDEQDHYYTHEPLDLCPSCKDSFEKWLNKKGERRSKMIWPNDISFEGFQKKIDNWYADKHYEMCDPPIDAQFALDLIFKTLVDDKDHYSYLTTMPESNEQTNSIMLDLILRKYSKKYRKFKRKERKNK